MNPVAFSPNVTSTVVGVDSGVDSGQFKHVVPVYGYPGSIFYVIHIGGFVSLSISILFSSGVLIYLLCPCRCDIWGRKIGERLVIYLAICDLGWSISHELDHAFMMALLDHPPDTACTIFGFLLAEFIFAQAILTTFTAFNAFVLVVKEVRLNLGRCDWRVLSMAFGVPCVLNSIAAFFGYLGPSGAW